MPESGCKGFPICAGKRNVSLTKSVKPFIWHPPPVNTMPAGSMPSLPTERNSSRIMSSISFNLASIISEIYLRLTESLSISLRVDKSSESLSLYCSALAAPCLILIFSATSIEVLRPIAISLVMWLEPRGIAVVCSTSPSSKMVTLVVCAPISINATPSSICCLEIRALAEARGE